MPEHGDRSGNSSRKPGDSPICILTVAVTPACTGGSLQLLHMTEARRLHQHLGPVPPLGKEGEGLRPFILKAGIKRKPQRAPNPRGECGRTQELLPENTKISLCWRWVPFHVLLLSCATDLCFVLLADRISPEIPG